MKKNILKVILGSIILEAVLVCVFILIGNFDTLAWRALGSVGIIIGYSIPCLFYSKIYDDEKYKYIAICGTTITCITVLISILRLWDLIGDGGDFLENLLGSFNVIIWLLVLISSLLSFKSGKKLLNIFKYISIYLMVLLALFINVIIWTETFPEGFLSRLYYILIVLTVGSFICTLILTVIYKKEIEKASNV